MKDPQEQSRLLLVLSPVLCCSSEPCEPADLPGFRPEAQVQALFSVPRPSAGPVDRTCQQTPRPGFSAPPYRPVSPQARGLGGGDRLLDWLPCFSASSLLPTPQSGRPCQGSLGSCLFFAQNHPTASLCFWKKIHPAAGPQALHNLAPTCPDLSVTVFLAGHCLVCSLSPAGISPPRCPGPSPSTLMSSRASTPVTGLHCCLFLG